MGYHFNQVGKWENGTKILKLSDFFAICKIQKIGTESLFNRLFWTYNGPFSELQCVEAVFKCLGDFELRGKLDKKKESLSFAEFLYILDRQESLLIAWVNQFMECQDHPLLKNHYKKFQEAMQVIADFPKIAFVLPALKLPAYQNLEVHDEILLARHSACGLSELRKILKVLVDRKFIIFDGKKYSPCPFEFSFSFMALPFLRGMTKAATGLAFERYSLIPSASISQNQNWVFTAGFTQMRTAAISKQASLEIRELISKLDIAIAKVIKNDRDPKENVQVILSHSFPSTVNSPEPT